MSLPRLNLLCCCVSLALVGAGLNAQEIVFADFETETYEGWKATGTAFGGGPAQGTLPGQMAVDGFAGKRLANSFTGGDGSTGTLTSGEFTIAKPYISFLIGGGGHAGKTCLNLLVEGAVARTATGPNLHPGGSERLSRQGWDVRDLAGKTARLAIVDDATGGWGHINVDQIVFTDAKPPLWLKDARRELTAEKHWLHFPIQNSAPARKVTLELDGQRHPPLNIQLAESAEKADWWAPFDLSGLQGKSVAITVDTLPDSSQALAAISQDDAIHGADPLYQEALRPQFHFSARRGWLNDPNGLVYHNDTWHLYFQHNPYGWNWGNMHWGHATSPDLLHWTEHGEALSPDASGTMFSGSAVVDWKNSSGFGQNGQPPLCVFYTAAGEPFTQGLAYSTDGSGRPLAKYAGNPIIGEITPGARDPKVIWHEPTQRWVLTLYVEKDKTHYIQFFTSTDLKKWDYRSEIAGFFECPDLFELPVHGGKGGEKLWVLTAASSEYMLGTFDGVAFSPVTKMLPGHRGKEFYAAQTYSDAPEGRRVQIGWLRAPSPGMPFNQCMSLPLELGLRQTADGPRLTMKPTDEVSRLIGRKVNLLNTDSAFVLNSGQKRLLLGQTAPEHVRLRVRFTPGETGEVRFELRGASINFDAAKQELVVNGHRAPSPAVDGKQDITVFLDRTTIEVFSGNGLTYVPMPFIAKKEDRSLIVQAAGGAITIESIEVNEVASIWKK